jgi:rhombotail lipoprotein
MKFLFKMFGFGFVFLSVFLVVSCSSQQVGTKSSVVDYLYPKDAVKVVEPSIPVLKLPIKLGIAFVPAQSSRKHGSNIWSGNGALASGLTEIKKMQILGQVSGHFKKYPFVGEIQEIPSTYLTPGGSFTNLDQIKTMYGIDVMALVSYDQVQFTDAGFLSVSYWTIVGAYLVSGEKNDTNTLMDTVVYDIASRKMLFRAPGTSIVKGRSTPVNLSEELRTDSIKSFDQAAKNMIENLDVQLAGFREKAKQNPEQIKVVKTEGYSAGGGGAFDWASLWFLVAIAGAGFLFRKQS